MISIEEGDGVGNGDFLLTAVKLTEPNFLNAVQAMWSPSKDVYLKKDVLQGYSKQQYADRLNVIMQGSQNNAVEAAYRYAGLPYASEVQSIIVSDAGSEGALVKSFKAGDKLLGIEGAGRFESLEQLLDMLVKLDGKKESVFEVERAGELIRIPVYSGAFSSAMNAEQMLKALGIGSLTELRSLEPKDSSKRLTIAAGEIGGPSAGLVFALQALDLLTEGDLSGGYRIAATGTITADGRVGAIGGIKQKIIISNAEGAQLFLAPAHNYEEAKAKAKAIGSSMKVVSVESLEQAIERINEFKEAAAQS
ncbi:Lon protease [compost metagenome]